MMGHLAKFLDEFFPNLDFSDFASLLKVTADGRTAATVIQTRPNQFATMPVAELSDGFQIESSGFDQGETIPTKYTCDGENVSPPLGWTDPPPTTKSIALILDDPDAPGGVFNHWVMFNLPAATTELAEGVPTDGELASGARQGTNSFGLVGYAGPCPPPGPGHRYFFKIFFLNKVLDLAAGATKAQVEAAMEGSIVGSSELLGRYSR